MNDNETLYPLRHFPSYSYKQLRAWKQRGLQTADIVRPEKTCQAWIDEFLKGSKPIVKTNRGGRKPKLDF